MTFSWDEFVISFLLTRFETTLPVEIWNLLRAWYNRFEANRGKAEALLGEKFCRMWEFYLITSELSFRYFKHMVFQIQLAKAVDTLPLQRDYMVDVERKLMSSEGGR